MNQVAVIFILVSILSIAAAAIQTSRYDDEPIEQSHKLFKQQPKQYIPKISSQQERELLIDILEKIENNDSNLTATLALVEKLVNMSPSTPKNFNFTKTIKQIEDGVRENVTKVLNQRLHSKDFPTVDTEVTRYKRNSTTNAACINSAMTAGQAIGGIVGTALGAAGFSFIPVLGTILGGALGGFLGQLVGGSMFQGIAKSACPP